MNEYLYETASVQMDGTRNDEKIMYVMANEKLHNNRKKNMQKEKFNNGEESNYDFYC